VSDCCGEKKRIVGMSLRDHGIETITPMRAPEEEESSVEIPDGKGVPSLAVGMGDDAKCRPVESGDQGYCKGCRRNASEPFWRFNLGRVKEALIQ